MDVNKKKEKTKPSRVQQAVFNKGHDFEDAFRNKDFPDGINVKTLVNNFAYFNSYSKHVLASNHKQTLYEATIIEDDILVMCDVLVKDGSGDIGVYEIKRSVCAISVIPRRPINTINDFFTIN